VLIYIESYIIHVLDLLDRVGLHIHAGSLNLAIAQESGTHAPTMLADLGREPSSSIPFGVYPHLSSSHPRSQMQSPSGHG